VSDAAFRPPTPHVGWWLAAVLEEVHDFEAGGSSIRLCLSRIDR
jgi:hypothetical protein